MVCVLHVDFFVLGAKTYIVLMLLLFQSRVAFLIFGRGFLYFLRFFLLSFLAIVMEGDRSCCLIFAFGNICSISFCSFARSTVP